MLEPILEKMGGVVCMSATLHPEEFYLELLGFDKGNFSFLSYRSMFPLENRNCYVISDVLTQKSVVDFSQGL